MSSTPPSDHQTQATGREELMSALFSTMVIQQANMALMFLGKVPHPETGKLTQDLEAARIFIDQLEMIQVKTRGNLTSYEDKLLKDSLMNLRMQFVDAAQAAPSRPADTSTSSPGTSPEVQPTAGAGSESTTAPTGTPEEESRKKFTKKY